MAASEAGVAFVTFLKSAGLPQKLWSVLLQKVEGGQLGVDGQVKVLQELSSHVTDCTGIKTHEWSAKCVAGARQRMRTEWARSLLAARWTQRAPYSWLRMQPMAHACRCWTSFPATAPSWPSANSCCSFHLVGTVHSLHTLQQHVSARCVLRSGELAWHSLQPRKAHPLLQKIASSRVLPTSRLQLCSQGLARARLPRCTKSCGLGPALRR